MVIHPPPPQITVPFPPFLDSMEYEGEAGESRKAKEELEGRMKAIQGTLSEHSGMLLPGNPRGSD